MHLDHDPAAPAAPTILFDDFLEVDIRAGTIGSASPSPEARKAACRLSIDLGPGIGTRACSAQIAGRYDVDALVGRRMMAVVNLPPRRIGPFVSEVLLGFADADGDILLPGHDETVPDGARLA